MSRAVIERACIEGVNARFANRLRKNPYPLRTPERDAWFRGYDHAADAVSHLFVKVITKVPDLCKSLIPQT